MKTKHTALLGLKTATIFILLLTSFSSIIESAYAVQFNTITTTIGLLAVEDHKGEVIKAKIKVYLGSQGLIDVDPRSLVAEDTYYSMKVGAEYAALLAGIDPKLASIHIKLSVTRRVHGPSASGFISLVIYNMLTEGIGDENISMTGFLSPSGFLLPVEGVCEKISAAKAYGYNRVVIPAAEPTACNPPNISVIRACSIPSLVAGIEELDIKDVRKTIFKAAPKIYTDCIEAFKDTAEKLIELAKLLKTRFAQKEGIPHILLDKSIEAYSNGDYYSSASLSYYYITRLILSLEPSVGNKTKKIVDLVLEKLGYKSIDALIREAKEVYQQLAMTSNNTNKISLWKLQGLSEIHTRLTEGLGLVNSTSIKYRIYGILRVYSSISWGNFTKCISGGPIVSMDDVSRSIDVVLEYLEDWISLLENLIEIPVNATKIYRNEINTIRELLYSGEIVYAYTKLQELIANLDNILILASTRSNPFMSSCIEKSIYGYALLKSYSLTPPSYIVLAYATKWLSSIDREASASLLSAILSKTFLSYLITSTYLVPEQFMKHKLVTHVGEVKENLIMIVLYTIAIAAIVASIASASITFKSKELK